MMVVVAGIGAGVWFGRGVTAPPTPLRSAQAPSTTEVGVADEITVHVAGWVEVPGMVRLDARARVGDAVAAAGGARPGAALAGVNLAQPLSDGQQVVVPGPESEEPTGATGAETPMDDGLVHLNTATVEELERLPGVGPVLAERIVAHREDAGGFETVEDLLEVSGIGEAKLASLRDHVAVP